LLCYVAMKKFVNISICRASFHINKFFENDDNCSHLLEFCKNQTISLINRAQTLSRRIEKILRIERDTLRQQDEGVSIATPIGRYLKIAEKFFNKCHGRLKF
jgi:hypothetical protein